VPVDEKALSLAKKTRKRCLSHSFSHQALDLCSENECVTLPGADHSMVWDLPLRRFSEACVTARVFWCSPTGAEVDTHLAELGVLNHRAIAAEFLLERLEHFLVIERGLDALYCG
jgi:hypothetical protein